MEIYKYVTDRDVEQIKTQGGLEPRRDDGLVYGFPEDPLLWGHEHVQTVIDYVRRRSGASALVVLQFAIDISDPDAFVQEGNIEVWSKFDTRKSLKDYRREDFDLPEVIIRHSIPFDEISVTNTLH